MYNLQGAGYNLLRNPDEFFETLGMKTSAQPSTQSSNLAPTKENQAKRAAQTQSKASSQPKKKKPGFESSFEAYESPYSKSPIYTPRYDWQNDQQERLRRFGIKPTAHTEPTTPQTTSRTQNRDAYDSRVLAAYAARQQVEQDEPLITTLPNGEEVFTPKGEAAFLEGFASIYEDDMPQRKSGDIIRWTMDNMPGKRQTSTRTTSGNSYTSQQTQRKGSGIMTLPSGEEVLTPEGEAAFLEGLASIYEDDMPQRKPGDVIRRSMDNMPERQVDENSSSNPDAIEFGENSETYRILQDLGERWEISSTEEQQRLHAVAEEVRRLARGGNRVKYAHDEIMETLHRNADAAIRLRKIREESANGLWGDDGLRDPTLESILYLIGMTNYGPWDYKWVDHWRVNEGEGKYYDGKDLEADNHKNWLPWMYFDGDLISADKLGNMNMSYVGKRMGLPEWVYKNVTTTDKDDGAWVQKGIDMAKAGR